MITHTALETHYLIVIYSIQKIWHERLCQIWMKHWKDYLSTAWLKNMNTYLHLTLKIVVQLKWIMTKDEGVIHALCYLCFRQSLPVMCVQYMCRALALESFQCVLHQCGTFWLQMSCIQSNWEVQREASGSSINMINSFSWLSPVLP